MSESQKIAPNSRTITQSVTCFLHCGDEYLFVHRTKKGSGPDLGRLNGIGGKREANEDFLTCAIRETQEETGYLVSTQDCRLVAVMTLHGGYPEDWVMCFFTISVPSKHIPNGTSNEEGELLWLHKDTVLQSAYTLVDDLHYCWQDIASGQNIVFFSAQVSDDEKISRFSRLHLPYTSA